MHNSEPSAQYLARSLAGRRVTVVLWESAQAYKAATPAMRAQAERLINPHLTAPSRVIYQGQWSPTTSPPAEPARERGQWYRPRRIMSDTGGQLKKGGRGLGVVTTLGR